ncbi:MAG: TonB-dependent receptor [Bacteroidales bacterium]|nr:TonB-dependent receptor [Bacteroidales bacterium]
MKKLLPSGLLFLSTALGVSAQESIEAALVSERAAGTVLEAADTVSAQRLSRSFGLDGAVSGMTGVQIRDYGGLGGLKTVNVRSLGSEHTGVYIDGILVDNAQNMQVDLGRLPEGNFSSVRLYTGGRDALLQSAREYGSANALYLESRAPKGRKFSASVTAGPFLAVQPYLSFENSFKRLGTRLSLTGTLSDGRYPFHVKDTKELPGGGGYDTTMVRHNSDLKSICADAQVFGQKGWRIRAYVYASERGLPGPVFKRGGGWPQSSDRQADADFFLQGSWKKALCAGNSMAVRGKYSHSATRYTDCSEFDASVSPVIYRYGQDALMLSISDAQEITPWWKAGAAADFTYNYMDSNLRNFVYPSRIAFYGAISTMLSFNRLKASVSLMYTLQDDIYGISDKSLRRTFLSPFASISYKPASHLTLSAFSKRSPRMPSFNDLYYTTVGNTGLKPEDAWQSELGARWEESSWSISLRGYHNLVSNKIIAVPTGNQFRWSMYNMEKVRIIGAEVKASYSRRFERLSVEAIARYTFQRAANIGTQNTAYQGHQVPYIPLHSGNLDLSLDFVRTGIRADVTLFLCGERWSSQANLPQFRLSPWACLDSGISKSFGKFSLSLRACNILNRSYQMVSGYPMPGFNVRLRACITL